MTSEVIIPDTPSSIPWPSASASIANPPVMEQNFQSSTPPRNNISRVFPVKKSQISPLESDLGTVDAQMPELIADEKIIQKSGMSHLFCYNFTRFFVSV